MKTTFKRISTLNTLIVINLLCWSVIAQAQYPADHKSTDAMNPEIHPKPQDQNTDDPAIVPVPVSMNELDPQVQEAIKEQTQQASEAASATDQPPSESKYTLGENDVIEIAVARHPELSGQYIINNEGKVQYEFIGDVKVAGLTKKDLAAHLKELLSKYVIDPDINVKIIGYNSKIVYVIGEVGSPGKIFMRGDTITIREALMQAGLPLLSANTPKGSLITPSNTGKAVQKNINIHKLLIEGDLRENLVMKPGDTLYVPPTFMAKAMRVIQPVAQPVGTAAGTARTVYTGGF